MTKRVYEHIASIMQASRTCRERMEQPLGGDAGRWYRRHNAALCDLLSDTLPHGSGFDSGVTMDYEASHEATQLVFDVPYHVMNENGFYIGWSRFRVVATPAFVGGFDLDIEQTEYACDLEDSEDLADYIGEVMHEALSAEFVIPSHYYSGN